MMETNDFAVFIGSCNAAGLVMVFLTGLFFGSFFNVCIYRLPRKLPIVFARSKCPCCREVLGGVDLLPIIGYLLRRGKCHYCANPISGRYPMVELLSAFLFLWCYTEYNFSVHFFKAAALTSFLLVIAFIDIDHRLILDKVLIWMGALGIVTNLGVGHGNWSDFLLAAALVGGYLYLTGGANSLGDAKLGFVIGLWIGVKLTILALFLALFTGTAAGLAVIVARRKNQQDLMPFSPFIAAGTFLSLLYGNEIIDWYLSR